ncbi:hypothetical protein FRC02_009115 [Tulasnella sp. 418]|nr:hypothetical protein FRC02_009115 [Tulasnella sp. 418]
MDDEARKVFEAVKADILDKIWELHKADDLHDLNEVYKLDHVKFFNPISYRVEEVPYGINYYGKIELNEKGHCIHARVFSPHGSKGPIKVSFACRVTEDIPSKRVHLSSIRYKLALQIKVELCSLWKTLSGTSNIDLGPVMAKIALHMYN